ncbi:ABC transporter permease [Clostridium sp. D33t1_170424_F3]|uniref:ABC transporter permease n=1 Tax=Clostridium sp. D33t1_170424_F3 TaxID=2787099 RepID=UPI0018AA8913|nr:ABC transporter permease [Clostridium sp. D33t1_170424_F3]
MSQSFRLAIKSIASSKMRSFLTMLGIIIGVASVIILVSLMQGMTNYISDSFSDLGTDQVSVSVTNTDTRNVDVDTMYAFLDEQSELFANMSPTVSVRATLKKGTESTTTTSITGVGEDYMQIKALELSAGRFIQYSDIVSRQKVCVIGSYVAQDLFADQNALSQTVKINGEAYTVIGILQEKADSEEGSSDDCVYLPYSVATKLSFSADISSYTFIVNNVDDMETAKTVLKSELYEIFKNEDLYTVTSLSEMLEMVTSMTDMMTLLLVGIAAISLLVAGIGIMNIMLVSVTERTREIGIRKSLGAKRRTILQQFIIEAGVTSAMGGLVGIALGCAVTSVVGGLIGLDATPSAAAILVSFGISAGIGVIFGYMPARRAAKLNPIDALRSE